MGMKELIDSVLAGAAADDAKRKQLSTHDRLTAAFLDVIQETDAIEPLADREEAQKLNACILAEVLRASIGRYGVQNLPRWAEEILLCAERMHEGKES